MKFFGISSRSMYAAFFMAGCVTTMSAAVPALLDEAFANWSQGKDDLSFVQRTRFLNDDGSLKEERVERYDPSLPDAQRWALLEVNGKKPTDSQREKIQDKRNKKPRKKAIKPLKDYFNLESARVVEDGKEAVKYELPVRPETARLIAVDKLVVGLSVKKDTKTIERVTAGLSEPLRIALGVAKVTDVDLDLRFDAEDDHEEEKKPEKGRVAAKADKDPKAKPESAADNAPSEADGTVRVVMSKLGNRAEYTWGEFKRVSRYQGGGKNGSVSDAGASGDEGVAPLATKME